MATIISTKMCFVCGTYGTSTNRIEKHHVVPRSMLSNVQNNTIFVCTKCHRGIHDRKNGLKPRRKQFRIMKTLINKYGCHHEVLIRKAMQITIVDSSKAILDYHRFLEYVEKYTK